jgi:hypothetical protein
MISSTGTVNKINKIRKTLFNMLMYDTKTFFRNDNDEEIPFGTNVNTNETINNNINTDNKLFELYEEYNIPIEIKILHTFFTVNGYDKLIVNYHHMFSPKNFIDRQYKNKKFIDLGMTYAGMGNFVVLSWAKTLNKYFIRLDGGANGYDRNDNYEFYENTFDPESPMYKDKMFGYDMFIKHLKNEMDNKNDFLIRS